MENKKEESHKLIKKRIRHNIGLEKAMSFPKYSTKKKKFVNPVDMPLHV